MRIAFLPGDLQLVTERVGRLRVIRNGVLDAAPVKGVPVVRAGSTTGLLDVALHPDFARNGFVYLSYNKPDGEKGAQIALARGHWDGRALVDTRDLILTGTDTSGCRDHLRCDRKLYMSVSGREEAIRILPVSPQVLRLNDDGSVPSDIRSWAAKVNRPRYYLGIARCSASRRIRAAPTSAGRDGPNGGDEVTGSCPRQLWMACGESGRKYPVRGNRDFPRAGYIDP